MCSTKSINSILYGRTAVRNSLSKCWRWWLLMRNNLNVKYLFFFWGSCFHAPRQIQKFGMSFRILPSGSSGCRRRTHDGCVTQWQFSHSIRSSAHAPHDDVPRYFCQTTHLALSGRCFCKKVHLSVMTYGRVTNTESWLRLQSQQWTTTFHRSLRQRL